MASNTEIYNLITSLCEKFTKDPNLVKKLRNKTYEILLFKKVEEDESIEFKNLTGADTLTNIRAWQFILTTKYGLEDYGKKLIKCAESVNECYGEEILKFLMCFRSVPRNTHEIEDICLWDELPNYIKNIFPVNENEFENCGQVSTKLENLDFWETAAKEKYSSRRTWEAFGYSEPDKEKPFITELPSSLWVKSLSSLYLKDHFQNRINLEIKPLQDFVQDLKHLLVGLSSYSFGSNENKQFYLIPEVTIEGILPNSLQEFCKNFIHCGNCYKELQKISNPNIFTGEYRQNGYIFKELCESMRRYLEFYRYAIIKLPDNLGLFSLDHQTKELRNQLITLTKICKLGPYCESGEIPHGVSLLNYLYQTILNEFDKKFLLVLCAIVYPCFQVYFSRFLQPWLIEGIINDPYNEFFIQINLKYIQTRGRTYWTRSFTVRNDIVPDFLLDLQHYILHCGKTMNLLKLCNKNSKFCHYLSGETPLIFSSCFTADQLAILQRNNTTYYLEVSLLCTRFKLDDLIRKNRDDDPILLGLIAKQRLATLRRIELERQKMLEENRIKKTEEMNNLREQYIASIKLKEERLAAEVEKEMKEIGFNLEMEKLKDELIKREANDMIEYYNNLCKVADSRRKKIEQQIEILKSANTEPIISTEATNSEESFYSASNLNEDHLSSASSSSSLLLKSSKSLDILNANCDDQILKHNHLETFELAKKIKNKVLREEMDIAINSNYTENKTKNIITSNNKVLTEAQRNKLKVLSSEFDLFHLDVIYQKKQISTEAEINRNTVLGTNKCFDNNNYQTKVDEEPKCPIIKAKPDKLQLKIDQPHLNTLSVNIVDTPMSIDSTPISDSLNFEKIDIDNTPGTASSCKLTDDGESINFDRQDSIDRRIPNTSVMVPKYNKSEQKSVFSKRVTVDEVSESNTHLLKIFLHESILIPLTTQTKLVNNEILKYFIEDLQYLNHLQSLRDYFFLQDGEFGRNITENLFEKLYDVHCPEELINCRTLHNLVTDALHNSSKYQEHSHCLSFKINSLPKRFILRDPDVLDCLSLSYKIHWPLNILLPSDTINKYDEVFKYILKLNRVSWILKKIFSELKILAKETGKKEIYLMSSPHYRRIHQCRHVMLHFIQTFQNYVVGEILQPSWEVFEKNLTEATNLDQLYTAHTNYIKSILFLCLLNQKSAILRKVIQNIFIVILKFYDYLRTRSWKCEDGVYIHPNFQKLNSLFFNFEEFVFYLFKVGKKIVKSGYQPQFIQLLDMLDINGYYSQKMNVV